MKLIYILMQNVFSRVERAPGNEDTSRHHHVKDSRLHFFTSLCSKLLPKCAGIKYIINDIFLSLTVVAPKNEKIIIIFFFEIASIFFRGIRKNSTVFSMCHSTFVLNLKLCDAHMWHRYFEIKVCCFFWHLIKIDSRSQPSTPLMYYSHLNIHYVLR